MYVLPVDIPVYDTVQEQRLDLLTTNEYIGRLGLNCHDRTALIFLRQTHIMLNKSNGGFNEEHYKEYFNIYYQAFLYYND